jgi:hypothetical protein
VVPSGVPRAVSDAAKPPPDTAEAAKPATEPPSGDSELNVTGYTKRGEPIYSRGSADAARKNLAATQTSEHKVTGNGKITVDVNAPKGVKVGAESSGLFKQTEVNRQTQMEPARKSDNRSQSGDEILSL